MSKPILVTATAKGFYQTLRRPGDVFEIADEQAFADRWMVRGGQTDAILKKRGTSAAEQARQEAAMAGGPSAALTMALADLKEAAAREAALLAKIAQLEGAVSARDTAIAEATVDVAVAEPETVAEAPEPELPLEGSAPVKRVRRTPAA